MKNIGLMIAAMFAVSVAFAQTTMPQQGTVAKTTTTTTTNGQKTSDASHQTAASTGNTTTTKSKKHTTTATKHSHAGKTAGTAKPADSPTK